MRSTSLCKPDVETRCVSQPLNSIVYHPHTRVRWVERTHEQVRAERRRA